MNWLLYEFLRICWASAVPAIFLGIAIGGGRRR